MDNIGQKFIDNKGSIIKVITIFIVVFVCVFIISKVSTKSSNCSKIAKYANKMSYTSLNSGTQICSVNKGNIKDLLLNRVFVKTAHDCCCSGEYRNDYVDFCALTNCRDEGVRALDFQIYSLKKKPIIASASVPGNKYKEMYNSLDFYTTMQKVKRLFLTSECSNFSDPLFLILRINSSLSATYEAVFSSLIEIFGSGSSTGNVLFVNTNNVDIGTIPLSNFISQVVICVYAYDAPIFYKSSLSKITALDLNTSRNKIRYETEILDLQLTTSPTSNAGKALSKNANILFPNQQTSSANIDFVLSGLYYGITFMGMNFQKADPIREAYDKLFTKGAFIEKLMDKQVTNSAIVNSDSTTPLYSINLVDKIAVLN